MELAAASSKLLWFMLLRERKMLDKDFVNW